MADKLKGFTSQINGFADKSLQKRQIYIWIENVITKMFYVTLYKLTTAKFYSYKNKLQ